MLVFLSSDYGYYELTPVNKRLARQYERDTGNESVLIQSDLDFPSLASNLGWHGLRGHKRSCIDQSGTDGTVTCPSCGATAGRMIEAVREYLDKRCNSVIRADVAYYFGDF